MSKYINPFTDFGFKKIFGEESSKNILLDFLNALMPNLHIKNLTFRNSEQLPASLESQKAIFDIYCENELGEKFIVELQKARQIFFKERMLYYSTHPIREQVEMNDSYKFNLKSIYCIGILDFKFNDNRRATANNEVIHTALLKDQNCEIFYDKLVFLYVEMPRFNKEESELVTRQDKWLYFIKHLAGMKEIPRVLNGDPLFIEAFRKAETAALSPEEHFMYVESIMVVNDWHAIIETAVEDAEMKVKKDAEIKLEQAVQEKELAVQEKEQAVQEKEQAVQEKEQAIKAIAKAMKVKGIASDIIGNITGISEEEIGML